MKPSATRSHQPRGREYSLSTHNTTIECELHFGHNYTAGSGKFYLCNPHLQRWQRRSANEILLTQCHKQAYIHLPK